MQVTAIIQRYYNERRKYIHDILDALALQTKPPAHVIVWNNFVSELPGLYHPAFNVHIISSAVNTLMGRYAAALLSSTPAVFIQDDDLLCGPSTIERLTERLTDFPHTLFGAFGSNLNRTSPHPYSTGTTVVEGPADIVLGRCFALTRRELVSRLPLLHPSVGRCDDIVLSHKGPNHVINLATDMTDLEEHGVGLRHDPQHVEERDQMVLKLWGRRV